MTCTGGRWSTSTTTPSFTSLPPSTTTPSAPTTASSKCTSMKLRSVSALTTCCHLLWAAEHGSLVSYVTPCIVAVQRMSPGFDIVFMAFQRLQQLRQVGCCAAFPLMLWSHSIRFTGAQGLPKCMFGFSFACDVAVDGKRSSRHVSDCLLEPTPPHATSRIVELHGLSVIRLRVACVGRRCLVVLGEAAKACPFSTKSSWKRVVGRARSWDDWLAGSRWVGGTRPNAPVEISMTYTPGYGVVGAVLRQMMWLPPHPPHSTP